MHETPGIAEWAAAEREFQKKQEEALRSFGELLKGAKEREVFFEGLKRKPEGETGISVSFQVPPGKNLRSRHLSLALEGDAPAGAREQLEKFARNGAREALRAAGKGNLDRAAEIARGIASRLRELYQGESKERLLEGEGVEAVLGDVVPTGAGQRRIRKTLRLFGRSAAIDIYEGLADAFEART